MPVHRNRLSVIGPPESVRSFHVLCSQNADETPSCHRVDAITGQFSLRPIEHVGKMVGIISADLSWMTDVERTMVDSSKAWSEHGLDLPRSLTYGFSSTGWLNGHLQAASNIFKDLKFLLDTSKDAETDDEAFEVEPEFRRYLCFHDGKEVQISLVNHESSWDQSNDPEMIQEHFQMRESLSLDFPDEQRYAHNLGELRALLLSRGSGFNTWITNNTERVNEPLNDRGWTPVFYAAAMGRHEVVKALLEAGADPAHRSSCGLSLSDLVMDFYGLKTPRILDSVEDEWIRSRVKGIISILDQIPSMSKEPLFSGISPMELATFRAQPALMRSIAKHGGHQTQGALRWQSTEDLWPEQFAEAFYGAWVDGRDQIAEWSRIAVGRMTHAEQNSDLPFFETCCAIDGEAMSRMAWPLARSVFESQSIEVMTAMLQHLPNGLEVLDAMNTWAYENPSNMILSPLGEDDSSNEMAAMLQASKARMLIRSLLENTNSCTVSP